ncbi:hypothetical protein HCZ30_06285 [Marivivens donghaensis]|uniref:Uncharacterized protein n=1 Tax=Marivivens donghaensis TaxID=1699413 RepID=A0ABX0VZH7_9RHOB|nr:hypothetical protein [Marivivens donghaensis]
MPGGRKWHKRALSFCDDLASTPELTSRLRREAGAILALISLDLVGDIENEEAALFAKIDVSSPIVDEICLLKDEMEDAMRKAGCLPVNGELEV